MAKFTLHGPNAGKTMTILDKYHFVDGVYQATNADALKQKTILCEFYSCSLELDPEVQVTEQGDPDTSLSASVTKAGGLDEAAKAKLAEEAAKVAEAAKAAEAAKTAETTKTASTK